MIIRTFFPSIRPRAGCAIQIALAPRAARAFLGFVDSGEVADGNPPQGKIDARDPSTALRASSEERFQGDSGRRWQVAEQHGKCRGPSVGKERLPQDDRVRGRLRARR